MSEPVDNTNTVCPILSTVVPSPEDPTRTNAMLSPCLGAVCKMFIATKVVDGNTVEGDCVARVLPGQLDFLNKSIRDLVQLGTVGSTPASIFGGKRS